MFAIRVDLLAGRYAATEYNDRDRVEWPPHPARLFSALVATWADGHPGTGEGDAELAALRWLEEQPAPIIVASPVERAGVRNAPVVFVPVNDVGVIKTPDHEKLDSAERLAADPADPSTQAKAQKQLVKLRDKLVTDTTRETSVPIKFGKHDALSAEQSLIDRRARQPRTFPCALPEQPSFAFEWTDAVAPAEVDHALSQLVQRLVRLGHSSSLVHARIALQPQLDEIASNTTRYVPDDREGDRIIRWVNAGQVERLCRAHAQHREVEPRVLPARFVRYREGARRTDALLARSVFDGEVIIYARVSGPRLPIIAAAGLSRQFRRALMSFADQPISEIISGHRLDGAPSETAHLAVVPLPVTMGAYADGALIGLAVMLPHSIRDEERNAVMRAIGHFEQEHRTDPGEDAPAVTLVLGDAGELVLRRVVWGEDPRSTLRPRTWTRASKRWASATPVALDRNPGNLHDPDPVVRATAFAAAQSSIVDAVQRIGLPPPIEVDVVRSCVLPGTAKPRVYPRFPSDTHKQQRVLVHVRVAFAEPVRGPILIGAGRYQGMGLCLPVDRTESGPS